MKDTQDSKKSKFNKELFIQVKWILLNSKSAIPYLIFSIIISIVFSIIGIYNVVVSKSLIDSAISGNSQQVIKWLVLMIVISLFSMLSTPIMSFLSTHSSTKLNQSIQKKIYKHLEYSDWLELSKYHSVNLLTRINSDVSTISSTLLSTIPNIVSLLVTLVGSFYTLIAWAPSIALVAVFIGPLLLLISKTFGSKLKKLYKQVQEVTVKYNSFMQESMQNIMITKTFCMEEANISKLENIQNCKYKLSMENTKFSVMASLSMNVCSTIAYFSIFTWGVLNISTGITTYGTFTAMLQLYSKIQYPFSSLAHMIPGLISTLAATERLMELESIPLEHSDYSNNSITLKNPSIKFSNVSFYYNKDIPIINNINLDILPGESVAFIGPSGEGKTTIIRLILALIRPTNGIISLNENGSLTPIDRNHRKLISYVPQGNTLFSGTIEDNLRYGNSNATIEEIEEALKNACALDFVNKLDSGIKTLVGEHGVGISEGQAQRLSIARSFLRKTPILILDEATSALDSESELKVLKSIKQLKHNPICLIITHRPSALNICHRIIKLDKGSIEEVNSYFLSEIASTIN